MVTTFVERLRTSMETTGPLCVGIDPHPGILQAWGLSEDASGAESFAMGMIDALGGTVAAFKPQWAFFEQWGSAGIAVLERCCAAIRACGAVVIADVKRGDIGSTMSAYAQAYLGDGPLGVDAMTASGYLGFSALDPAFDLAEANDRAVFVLARTSNREGTDIQTGRTASGHQIAQSIVDQAVARNLASAKHAIGLVVGGTHESIGIDLSGFLGPILVPGIGTQGGRVSQLGTTFADTDAIILPSVSREVSLAGPDPQRLRQAVATVLGT